MMRRDPKADIEEAVREAFERSCNERCIIIDDESLDLLHQHNEWTVAQLSHGWSLKPLELLHGMRESIDRMEKEAATPDTIWLARPQGTALYWYCDDLFRNPKEKAGLKIEVRPMYLDVLAIQGSPKDLREWINLMEEKIRRLEARNNERKRTGIPAEQTH